MSCAACTWPLDGPIDGYRLVPDGGDPIGVGNGIKLTVFACRNCGYVRLHSTAVIDDDPALKLDGQRAR